MNGYGIPDYEESPEWGWSTAWGRWRCRRKGGHFGPIARFVLRGNSDVNSLVCSNPKCRAYLGPIPFDYYASLEPPSPLPDLEIE
jgi:hypothetical protein